MQTQDTSDGLSRLRAEIVRDLGTLAYPFKRWMPQLTRPDGQSVFDVVIVGAGHSGIGIAAGLKREQVDNILVIDEADYGFEGPWMTFARMLTLRSPKYLIGPDLGIPSLTFRRWYEAQWGEDAWDNLNKIPNQDWQNYMLWLRDVLDLPVQNRTRLTKVERSENWFDLTLEGPDGVRSVSTRKLVLATGVDGAGQWHIPDIVSRNLAKTRYAHASETDIEFAALKGKQIAVLGAGASAFDQAATALEAGAKSVHLFTRRNDLHRVQPYKHLEKSGFLGGFADLPDEWRWRLMNHIISLREPPPAETVMRTAQNEGFTLVTGAPWQNLEDKGDHVAIGTPKGRFEVDYIICGTGFEVAIEQRPELAAFQEMIARWSDRYTPEAGQENEGLGAYPYLGPGFELTEKTEGQAPWLSDIHHFTFGSTLSLGFSGGGMNGLKYALPRAINGIVNGLFRSDIQEHYESLVAYDVEEFDLHSVPRVI